MGGIADGYSGNQLMLLSKAIADGSAFAKLVAMVEAQGGDVSVLKNVENLFIEFHNRNHEDNTLDEILKWAREAGFITYVKEAWNNMPHPFTKKDIGGYHLQLNIFCYR